MVLTLTPYLFEILVHRLAETIFFQHALTYAFFFISVLKNTIPVFSSVGIKEILTKTPECKATPSNTNFFLIVF